MSRTMIDLDDEAVAAAQRVLRTRTKRETVNAALRRVAAELAAAEEFEWWATDPLPDLRDPAVMAEAWR
ncbi:MAG: DUF2191 domain-containing protein [Micromonosporaceae bacterium]|nr:DUF2191 domain-containing protein [Micromonosporaceae bacterium]